MCGCGSCHLAKWCRHAWKHLVVELYSQLALECVNVWMCGFSYCCLAIQEVCSPSNHHSVGGFQATNLQSDITQSQNFQLVTICCNHRLRWWSQLISASNSILPRILSDNHYCWNCNIIGNQPHMFQNWGHPCTLSYAYFLVSPLFLSMWHDMQIILYSGLLLALECHCLSTNKQLSSLFSR